MKLKQYRLLIESPEYPNGIIVESLTNRKDNHLYKIITDGWESIRTIHALQIENRPTVWEEITEEETKKEFLKVGDTYYYFDEQGSISETIYRGAPHYSYDDDRIKNNNYFKIKEAAEHELIRRRGMSGRWKPDEGMKYYYYSIHNKINHNLFSRDSAIMKHHLFLGNCHCTEQEALEWGKTFWPSWQYLLDN